MRTTTSTAAASTSGLHRMLRTVALWQERRRGRGALAQLGAYQLKDIGLVPGDALAEVSKPFWRA